MHTKQESLLQKNLNVEHLVAVASTGVIGVNLANGEVKKWN